MHTPFFPTLRPRLAPAKRTVPPPTPKSVHQLEVLLGRFIPTFLLSQSDEGPNSRDRIYSVRRTFWAFLWQALHPKAACREVVRQLLATGHGPISTQHGSAAYCRARERLSGERLGEVFRATAQKATAALWRGHEVKLVDGTTLSMPDTAANQKTFPQSASQKPGCGFPIVKIVALFSLASGLALDWTAGSLRVHEVRLFRKLWEGLRPNDLVIGDRGFSSYTNLALLLDQGVFCLFRLHQGKKVRHPRRSRLKRKEKLGSRQWLVEWKKPYQKPEYMRPKEWADVPSELQVRVFEVVVCAKGMRTTKVVLVTTLLDPVHYPVEELAQLYLKRWQVELSFRDLKTTLGMEVLRCKSPAMVEKEVWMHLIAFNLLRRLMMESARTDPETDYGRLSFKGTLDTVRQHCPAIAAAGTKRLRTRLISQLLHLLALDRVPLRPERWEPRAVKRRPKPYQLLTKHRHRFRELAHRSKYRKGNKRKFAGP